MQLARTGGPYDYINRLKIRRTADPKDKRLEVKDQIGTVPRGEKRTIGQ
jgi:hypothetical protein